jgi:HD-GYP domain-containing protein (c-di-GMP phosphodiesterase class II)
VIQSTPTAQTHPPVESASPGLQVLKELLSAWQAAALYDENNNAYRARREQLAQAIKVACASGEDCRIVYQGGYFFFNGNRLNYDRAFYFGRALAFRFSSLKLGELTIWPDVSPQSIDQALFTLAHTDTCNSDPFHTLIETWSTLNIDGVTVGPVSEAPINPWDQEDRDKNREIFRRQRAHALFGRAEAVVQEMWERVRDRNSFDASTTQRIVHQLIDQIAHDEEVLLEFVALKDFDEYTYYHSVNVAIYAIAVGMRLGLDRRHLTQLGMAALFHDIGKVKLPQDLISKPTEFNDDDWAQMKLHPVLGALTIASLRQFDADTGTAMAGAFEHHLNMDSSGYPKLTRPRKLHLFSRIIAICDAFDAMTSGRVYQKESISPDEAIRRLLNKGGDRYDPIILKALVHVLGVFPVGTFGKLSDGSLAIVIRNRPEDLYAPEVLIIRDSGGTPTRRVAHLSGSQDDLGGKSLFMEGILDPSQEGIDVGDYIAVSYLPTEESEGSQMT